MKKIGIITFCNCANYGAELQAYALQHVLNEKGACAEVVHIEKEQNMLEGQWRTVFNAIANRYKTYGLIKGTRKTIELIQSKRAQKKATAQNQDKVKYKKQIFDDFFERYVTHSSEYYTLEGLRHIKHLPYQTMVAGSDQIWNYKQTRYLDVFFLNFASSFAAKKVSYAASFSIDKIPIDLKSKYKTLIEGMNSVSVREDVGLDLVKSCCDVPAVQVLDPTLLIKAEEWVRLIGNSEYLSTEKKYVVIYTLSGSKYIYNLAKFIAKKLGVEILNIKSGFERVNGDDGIIHLYDVGPREFISIYSKAAYVITDSFHGTAFSINFNVPFTTLLNPVSSLNSRALSLLRLSDTMDRLIYDDGSNKEPMSLHMDFSSINKTIDDWRKKSFDFIETEILN